MFLQIFAMLWGTNELLSSFDSINCLPPSRSTGLINNQTSWLHADQAPLRRGFFCIQVMLAADGVGILYNIESLLHCQEGLGMSSICACKSPYKCTDAASRLAGMWCLCRDLSTWWMWGQTRLARCW